MMGARREGVLRMVFKPVYRITTFVPPEKLGAGKVGEMERVPSVRLEFVIPRDQALLERLLTEGLIPSHPWEEPAVFIDETLVTLTQTGP